MYFQSLQYPGQYSELSTWPINECISCYLFILINLPTYIELTTKPEEGKSVLYKVRFTIRVFQNWTVFPSFHTVHERQLVISPL